MILTKLRNEAELQHVWKYWRACEVEHWKTRNSYVDGRCWNKCLLMNGQYFCAGGGGSGGEGRLSSFEFTKGRRSLPRSSVMKDLLKSYRKSAVDVLTWHGRSPPSCGEVKMSLLAVIAR